MENNVLILKLSSIFDNCRGNIIDFNLIEIIFGYEWDLFCQLEFINDLYGDEFIKNAIIENF